MKSEARKGMIVWAALLALTCASVAAAEFVPWAGVLTTIVVVLGYVKARLIFVNYMELHKDAKPFRAILEVWGVVAVLVVLVPYWMSIL